MTAVEPCPSLSIEDDSERRVAVHESVLVFTRTKHGADRVVRDLEKAGVSATAMHADKSQSQRTRALQDFKDGKTHVLVATDIAQRGLDISNISHVINYDVPQQAEDYVHRIGRTGRAARKAMRTPSWRRTRSRWCDDRARDRPADSAGVRAGIRFRDGRGGLGGGREERVGPVIRSSDPLYLPILTRPSRRHHQRLRGVAPRAMRVRLDAP